jgi:signal peptidase II
MAVLLVGMLAVPALDHLVKLVLLERLTSGSVSLGPFGAIRVVRSRIWMARPPLRLTPGAIWVLWLVSASLLALVTAWHPGLGWPAGLLVGGALSHALEMSVRGAVCDYVCLGRWPAFDLADAALTVGALGMAATLAGALRGALWP